jgi:hypothetical protein
MSAVKGWYTSGSSLHKTQGELSEMARTLLAGLAEYLNEYTLVELKSPSDTLRAGDFRTSGKGVCHAASGQRRRNATGDARLDRLLAHRAREQAKVDDNTNPN